MDLFVLWGHRCAIAMSVGVAMATMGAGNQVVLAQGAHRPYRYGFLSGVKVRSAFKNRLAQQVANVIFQRPDFHHLAQIIHQFFFGQRLFFDQG